MVGKTLNVEPHLIYAMTMERHVSGFGDCRDREQTGSPSLPQVGRLVQNSRHRNSFASLWICYIPFSSCGDGFQS